MEKKTKSNPLGLRIGQRIMVSKKAFTKYDSSNLRTVRTYDLNKPLVCYVLRCTSRAEGKYIKGFHAGFEQDYEPAYLEVSKYVRLYQCAVSLTGKMFLVRPEDIILT